MIRRRWSIRPAQLDVQKQRFSVTGTWRTTQQRWSMLGVSRRPITCCMYCPLFHTHGLFVALHCVLASGSSMTLLDAFDVDVVLDELPRTTVLMGVPTHYSRLLERKEFAPPLVNKVRLFTSGSAPMPLALHERFRDRVGSVVLERYGMTETSMLTSNPLVGERKPGTVGTPLPGVRVRVVDDEDTKVADGTVGHVQVAGPNVFNGYWRRPELQETEFTVDGWFRTGDLGRFDADGYLELVGTFEGPDHHWGYERVSGGGRVGTRFSRWGS